MQTLIDYYAVLGIPPDASEQEIKEAYRHLAKQYHPDVNREPGAQAHFIEITGAYEVLVDPVKRRDYDALRASHSRDIPDGQETIWNQPEHNAPGPQHQAPQPSSPPLNSTPKSRSGSSKSRIILLVALILPFIGGSLGLFYTTTMQTALDYEYATATAQAHVNAVTEAVHANATADTEVSSTAIAATATSSAIGATATAQAHMTATAVAAHNPDPSFTRLALDDPLADNSKGYGWDETKCTFSHGVYTESTAGGYSYCSAANTDFSDFVYQAHMKVTRGDCGGIVFRLSGNTYDFFLVCQDQSYALFIHKSGELLLSATTSGTSPAIHRGLSQTNFVAVEAEGRTIKLYVNQRLIDSVNDNITNQGQIGVIADDLYGHPTAVTFSNADVWVR